METDERTASTLGLEDMRWVRGLAAGLVADAGLAEDVAQETLIAAWRRAPTATGVTRAWLSAVARNVLRQHRRGESRRAVREQHAARAEALPSSDELATRIERQRLLADALTRLAEPYRTTVLLRYSEELTPTEIAHRQHLPPGTVRRRLKEGLDRLRTELDREFAGDRSAWANALLPFFAPPTPELALAGTGATWISIAGGIAMKKLVLASLIAVLAGGVYFLARDSSPALGRPDSSATTELARSDATPSTSDSLPAPDPALDARPNRTTAPIETAPAHPAPLLLTGRVELPRDAPDDPDLEVFALRAPKLYSEIVELIDAHPFDDDSRAEWTELLLARAPVTSDSRFSLELPPGTERAHLALRGRFHYLPETRACEAGPIHVEPLLAPKLGACLTGRLTPASDDLPRALLADVKIDLDAQGGKLTPSDGVYGRGFDTEVRSAADGSFELRALPIDAIYGLVARPGELGAARTFVESLRPGETRTLELALAPGASLAGRVRAADNAPVAGATVTANFVGRWFGMDRVELREDETDADGLFTLREVGTGTPVSLIATHREHLESVATEVTLAPGEERTGLELALAAGASLAGRVTFPDGAPAAALEVDVSFDRAHLGGERALNALRGAGTTATTDANGRFVAGGLGAGPFTVTCESVRDELRHRARRDGVVPDGNELALVLHAPQTLAGRVVDESGEPLARFRVQCARVVTGAFGEMALERAELLFEDARGAFAFEDLDEGRYELYAIADAHVSPEPLALALPQPAGAPPIELSTLRSARARGVVLDPEGAPVAGARVRVMGAAPGWMSDVVAGTPQKLATTDALGRFALEALAPGALRFEAEAEGYAPSAPLALELAPGDLAEGLELALARGAALTGEVYDAQGAPAASWVVNARLGGLSDARYITTDGQGRFALADLPAGTWEVFAVHMNRDWKVDEQGVDYGQIVSDLRMASVTLEAGASEHLVLGEPPRAPVRVHGRVTHAGEARGGVMIAFQPGEGGKPVFAGVGAEGAYELVVDGGGTYNVSLQSTSTAGGGFDALDFVCDVPDVPEHELDFALPTGRIAGRVEGPDGDPVAGARVSLYADTRKRAPGEGGERFAETIADSDGRYSIDALDAGTYALQAGGARFGGGRAEHARIALVDIELEAGASRDDVDFILPAPGSVEVSVIDAAGVPVAGAWVYARGADGLIVDPLGFVATDAAGVARLDGIAPGEVTLFARTSALASPESKPVRVLAGELERATLTLAPGTILWVRLLDEHGEPLVGSVEVYDDEARMVGNVFALLALDELYQAGAFAPTQRRFGPLPAGKYTVRAATADGQLIEKAVSLRGQEERSLSLRLRE